MEDVVILGAGPAGLAAAYGLARQGKTVHVLEKSTAVGGLSRTTTLQGCQFDLGPHIFIKRNPRIIDFWKLIGQGGLFEIQEDSRQYCNGTVYRSLADIFFNLPLRERVAIVANLLKRRMWPIRNVASHKDQIVNEYGEKMYALFNEVIQKKYWGMNPSEIEKKRTPTDGKKASVRALAKKTALTGLQRFGLARKASEPKGHTFFHHKYGSGQMYENLKAMTEHTENAAFHLGCDVVRIRHDGKKIQTVEAKDADGTPHSFTAHECISTIPLDRFVRMMEPKPPTEVLEAAGKLFFRNLVMVNLVVKDNPFAGQWMQVISDDLTAYRITNFCNLSKDMGNRNLHPIAVEYNCFEKDGIWKKADHDIIGLAKEELARAGLVKESHVVDASVFKAENVYPVYFIGYEKFVTRITDYLSGFGNLQAISRSSIYRYNNMGHAVESGLVAADKLLGKKADVQALSALDGTQDIYNNV